jgi:isoquinoline 1-oxidoreductase beta subunit
VRPDIARYARIHLKPQSAAEGPTTPSEGPSLRSSRQERSALSRRAFLETSAAGTAFVLSFHIGGEALAQSETPPPKEKPVPNPFDAWIKIAADGGVTLTLAKSEMGQGAMTALPMILAEELDVDWSKVKVEQALSNPAVYDHGTGGSGSIKDSYTPLRRAGAAARAMLVGAAAERLKVDAAACKTDKGAVLGPAGQRLAYGELVGDAAKRPLPDFKTVPLKSEASFRIIGTNAARGHGVKGRQQRPSASTCACRGCCTPCRPLPDRRRPCGSTRPAKAVPGVKQVVEIPPLGAEGAFAPGGVAVVAESTWAAIQGRAALGVEWDHGPHAAESSATLRAQMEQATSSPGTVCRNDGDCDAGLLAAARKIEAVYELPFEAHACMEPMNATVHVRPDG